MCEGNRLEFTKKISSMKDKEYMETYLAYGLAPVISGHKPASTINLTKIAEWNLWGKAFISQIGLEYVSLRETKNSMIVLIYKRELLEEYLYKEKNNNFLIKLGYKEYETLDDYLIMLQERYNMYNCPHELGVFLGFPIEDVEDYMNCTSKKCIMCGYWQVFNNKEDAIRIFKSYDNSKEYVVNNILKGIDVVEVASNLKAISN